MISPIDRKVRQQLVRSRIVTLTQTVEYSDHFRAECSCGWNGRRVKILSTARKHMYEHYRQHENTQ